MKQRPIKFVIEEKISCCSYGMHSIGRVHVNLSPGQFNNRIPVVHITSVQIFVLNKYAFDERLESKYSVLNGGGEEGG